MTSSTTAKFTSNDYMYLLNNDLGNGFKFEVYESGSIAVFQYGEFFGYVVNEEEIHHLREENVRHNIRLLTNHLWKVLRRVQSFHAEPYTPAVGTWDELKALITNMFFVKRSVTKYGHMCSVKLKPTEGVTVHYGTYGIFTVSPISLIDIYKPIDEFKKIMKQKTYQ